MCELLTTLASSPSHESGDPQHDYPVDRLRAAASQNSTTHVISCAHSRHRGPNVKPGGRGLFYPLIANSPSGGPGGQPVGTYLHWEAPEPVTHAESFLSNVSWENDKQRTYPQAYVPARLLGFHLAPLSRETAPVAGKGNMPAGRPAVHDSQLEPVGAASRLPAAAQACTYGAAIGRRVLGPWEPSSSSPRMTTRGGLRRPRRRVPEPSIFWRSAEGRAASRPYLASSEVQVIYEGGQLASHASWRR